MTDQDPVHSLKSVISYFQVTRRFERSQREGLKDAHLRALALIRANRIPEAKAVIKEALSRDSAHVISDLEKGVLEQLRRGMDDVVEIGNITALDPAVVTRIVRDLQERGILVLYEGDAEE